MNYIINRQLLRIAPRKFLKFYLLLICVSLLATQSFSQEATDSIKNDSIKKKPQLIDTKVDYASGDSLEINIEEQKIFLHGKADVTYGSTNLKSGYMEFNMEKNTVYAVGIKDSTGEVQDKPEFKDGDENFTSTDITYNFKTKKGLIHGVFSKQSGGYLHGETTKKANDGSIHVRHAKYTTCDKEHPDFYIHLHKAIVIPNNKIITKWCNLVVADVPLPIGLPFGFFPNKKGSHSGILIPTYGESATQGFFLRDGGMYLHLNEYFDLKLTGEFYTKGSWGVDVASSYNKRYRYSGSFSLDYNKNKYAANYDTRNSTIHKENEQFSFRWNHRQDQKSMRNASFSADVQIQTSGFSRQNSETSQDYINNQLSSSVSYSKSFVKVPINFSANLRHSQNNATNTINVSLPVMSMSLSRLFPFQRKNPVGKQRWYEKISISYDANFENSVQATDSTIFTSDAPFEWGYQHNIPISASYKFLKFFSFNPSLSYQGVMYPSWTRKVWVDTAIVEQRVDEFRYAHSFGPSLSVSFNPKIYTTFAMKSQNTKLVAVRYLLTPTVTMGFTPEMPFATGDYYDSVQYHINGAKEKYYFFENNVYGTPQSRAKAGSVRISLDNSIEMKLRQMTDTGEVMRKVKLLEGFSIGTGYDIIEKKWSNLGFNARTRLLNILDINMSGTINQHKFDTVTSRFIDDEIVWTEGKLGQLSNLSASTGISFNSATGFKREGKAPVKKEENMDEYGYFKVPWSVSVNYSYSYNKSWSSVEKKFEGKSNQTLNFSGNLSLTTNWTMTFQSGYDFDAKKLSYTNCSISRNMHCWDLVFTWVPFGYHKSYFFEIRVKESILKDVKYTKRQSWQENLY